MEVGSLDEVETIRGGLKGLYVGKVLTCEAHPNSDHLHVTTVDLGKGEPQQIVCGAPNVAAGQKVIVADLGCVLYDGDNEFTIKKSKLRGVESLGMICAEDEIGVGTAHDGIIVLPEGRTSGSASIRILSLRQRLADRYRYHCQPCGRIESLWSGARPLCLVDTEWL